MQLTPDALKLLGLTLDWNRLALLLGTFALLTLVGRRRDALLERVAMWGLLAALLGGSLAATLPSWSALQGQDWGLARSVLDLRTGTLSLGWALGSGLLTTVLIARRRVPELLPALLGAALIGAAPLLLKPAPTLSTVPLLLKPAPTLSTVPLSMPMERYASPGERGTSVTFRNLPGPTLVNVWASWCPPCRLEMPLLVSAARRGIRSRWSTRPSRRPPWRPISGAWAIPARTSETVARRRRPCRSAACPPRFWSPRTAASWSGTSAR